ncbi:Trichothecene efflux pump TRI12 like protein [Verticillium longisporum]|nr:Trichothecene efflux pump TRI12 like protein [Verticillium longisporum]
MVLSFVFLTNAPIATFGPIIARKFVNTPSLGWRWCFYINIICVGITIILLHCFYHPPTFDLLHERKTKRQLMRELDYLRIFLWTAGLTLLLMGVSWGGNMYPWKSTATISSLIIGASLLVALFFWEGYADLKYPAIPIKFFFNRGWFSLVICATVASMFYYSAVLLWPQQVQALYTRDITYAGWLSTTVASSTALGQIIAGAIVKWGGNVRYWIIFSTFAMVGFVGALASLTPETKNTGIALTIIGPFFVGFIELAALALAPLYCKPADIGLASGLLASIRSAGGSVAVAVYTTILANQLSTTIPSNIAGPAIEAGLPANQVGALAAAVRAGKMATFPGITDSIQEAVRSVLPIAYSQAFKTVYLASLGFGGIAIVGCLFLKDAQKHLTDRVERRMGDGKRKPELEAKTIDDPRRESREIQEGA